MSAAQSALITLPEQVQLADTVARFVRERYAHRDWRAIVDSPAGMCTTRWQAMADLGWLGLGLPEACGAYGGGLQDALTVIEGLAAGLAPEPLASSVLVCGDLIASAISRSPTGATRTRLEHLIERIVAGQCRLAFAHDEGGNGFTATQLASTAHAVETGWSLAGSKRLVADAPHADTLIVSARIAGAAGDDAIALFLVPVATPGLRLHAMAGFDRRRLGDVRFDGLLLPPEALLVAPGEAVAAIRRALGRSVCALAAEASGLCGWLTQATREYLTGRRQFGVALVSFQVLQHRLVELQSALAELRTAVRIAAISCEAGEPDGVLVSAAKVKVARAGRFIGYQAIQLFGGMGMTDEMPVGDYAKRLEAIALLAGGVDVHLDRIVAAGGVTG